MTTHLATSLAPAAQHTPRRTNARVALFNLPQNSSSLLTECFRQFGIETLPISEAEKERLRREKFDGCVLPLEKQVGSTIELARGSASNSRLVIYGLGGSAHDALRYSKYCINAVFHEPLERSAATKLVRATRPLVLHEFRRYVRVPLMTDVSVVAGDGSRFAVTSQDISSGGMSLKGTANLEPGQLVEVSFALLTLPRIWVRGHITWKKPNKSVGVRFDVADERRRRLKDWIVAYLDS
jgi:hypothetical protein